MAEVRDLSSEKNDSRPWLIGGPARCGKTSLARAVEITGGSVAVLPVDALFPAYLRRWIPLFPRNKKAILREYLLRPRYVDPGRTHSVRPIDAFTSSVEEIMDAVLPKEARHHITLFAAALDRLAYDQGRRAWLAFDVHPELQFHVLRRLAPGLRLIVMLRDPREAVAASLYWRTFPERLQPEHRQIQYRLLLWVLSAQTGFLLASAEPETAMVVSFNRLLAGADQGLAKALDMEADGFVKVFDGLPLFSFDPGRGFLCPDGEWRPLLSAEEMALIEIVARPWMDRLNLAQAADGTSNAGSRRYRLLTSIVLRLGRSHPAAAKSLAELSLLPGPWWARWIAGSKQRLRDLRDAGRLIFESTSPAGGRE